MILEGKLRAEASQGYPYSDVTGHLNLRESLKICGCILLTSEPDVSLQRQCKIN